MTEYKNIFLFYMVLPVVMAGHSFLCQYLLSSENIHLTLFIIDISLSVFIICLSNKIVLIFISFIQTLFSLFCSSYIEILGTPPTLNSIINGYTHISGIDISSLLTYIDLQSLYIFSGFFIFQIFLCRYRTTRYRLPIALASLILCIGMHIDACAKQPFSVFSPEETYKKAKKGFFTPPIKRSIQYREYIATFIIDYLYSDYITPPPSLPGNTDKLPLIAPSDKISFIQVECLDFELVEQQVDGKFVMPFLHSLLADSILLRLDGTKKLASANSDFEIFNGLEARQDIVHYEYETSYPRSLIAHLVRTGLPAEVFHGLPADYMNLKAAYKLQGFTKYHDLYTMKQAGVEPINCWWAGVISDKSLFDYAAKHITEDPFIHFIITMTMHLPEHVDKVVSEKLFTSSKKSNFFTLAHDTDAALKHYIQSLPDGAIVFLWGDHRSYSSDNSGTIPFIVYKKGEKNYFDGRDIPDLTRSNMYYYIKHLFNIKLQ